MTKNSFPMPIGLCHVWKFKLLHWNKKYLFGGRTQPNTNTIFSIRPIGLPGMKCAGERHEFFPEVETKTDALEAEMPSDAEGEDTDMTGPAFDAIIHKGWKVSTRNTNMLN